MEYITIKIPVHRIQAKLVKEIQKNIRSMPIETDIEGVSAYTIKQAIELISKIN